LYERLNAFAAHVLQIGKSLGDSVKAYNRAIGSLERMVLPGARRFTELGVSPKQELTPVPPIEETPREATVLPDASSPAAVVDSVDAADESDEPADGGGEEESSSDDDESSSDDDASASE